jgi:ribonuclease-3
MNMANRRRRKSKGELDELETVLHYRFKNKDLLALSLVHSSYAYENADQDRDNEVMEFLGDSVVGLIAAHHFYALYPEATEGDLSKLKSAASSTIGLAEYARQVKLGQYIRLGKGEEKSGGRTKDSILAGMFEAVVAALYLDGGYEAARNFYQPLLKGQAKKIKGGGDIRINNYKSALQEFLQKEDLPAPHYKLVSESGPDHKKDFLVEVFVNKTSLAKAHGSSRKNAELKAAEMALKSFFGKKIESLTQETFVFKK